MIKFIIGLLFFAVTGHATLNDVDKQAVWGRNVLANGGFENGKAGWTASGGSFATVMSGSNLLTGKVTVTWDSNGASQTLTTSATIPKGLYGKNGVAVCKTQTPSGTATHTLGVTATAGTLVSSAITSSTTPVYDYRSFIFPSSGSVTIAITSVAADEPLIAIDDCFLGDASEVNLTNVSQAQFIGSAYIPVTANCLWSRSNTAIGAFTSDADCPGPTVEVNPGPGTIQTTDADLPQFTVNNLPPGTYQVIIAGPGIPTGSNAYVAYAIYDGTDTRGEQGGASSLTTMTGPFSIVGTFTYSSAGNRTFAVHGRASANTVNIDPRSHRVHFSIYRFPSSSEQAYRPDVAAQSWSGYHANDCSWARTNTAYGDPTADATCTFTERTNSNFGTVTTYTVTNAMPGIVFTPKKAGRYFVCALPQLGGGSVGGATYAARLWDGTTTIAEADGETVSGSPPISTPLCGIYVASSTSAKTLSIQTSSSSGSITVNAVRSNTSVEWSIFAIDQQIPAPLLVNSVVTKYSGVMGTEHAEINCDASSALTQNPGSWLSSIGNRSTAACALTIASGVFSATPYSCQVTVKAATVQATACSCSSATSCTVYGASADYDAYVSITGPR